MRSWPIACAVVSCHVERPLDDAAWAAFAALQARRPAGLEIAALMRPPDPAAGESESLWLARARIARRARPVRPAHALGRPGAGAPDRRRPGRARRAEQVAWLHERGLRPRLFAGGGWYMDEGVAAALAELDLADCTATAFRPSYLAAGRGSRSRWPSRPGFASARRRAARAPGHALARDGRARGARAAYPPTSTSTSTTRTCSTAGRRRALEWALRIIGRRRRPERLDRLRRRRRASTSARRLPRPEADVVREAGAGGAASAGRRRTGAAPGRSRRAARRTARRREEVEVGRVGRRAIARAGSRSRDFSR